MSTTTGRTQIHNICEKLGAATGRLPRPRNSDRWTPVTYPGCAYTGEERVISRVRARVNFWPRGTPGKGPCYRQIERHIPVMQAQNMSMAYLAPR